MADTQYVVDPQSTLLEGEVAAQPSSPPLAQRSNSQYVVDPESTLIEGAIDNSATPDAPQFNVLEAIGIKPAYDYYVDRLGRGGIERAINNYDAVLGTANWEDIKPDVNEQRIEEERDARISKYEKDHGGFGVEDLLNPIGALPKFGGVDIPKLHNVLGSTIEAMPFLIEAGKSAAVGAAATGTIGLAGGPHTAIAGLAMGGTGGAAIASLRVNTGMVYGDLRNLGFSHNEAVSIAKPVGVAMAAIDVLQLRGLTMIARRAVIQDVKEMVKTGQISFIREFLKEIGTQSAEETAQEVLQIFGEVIGGIAYHNSGAIPTWEQLLDRISRTIKGAVEMSLGTVGGAKGLGHAWRKVVKAKNTADGMKQFAKAVNEVQNEKKADGLTRQELVQADLVDIESGPETGRARKTREKEEHAAKVEREDKEYQELKDDYIKAIDPNKTIGEKPAVGEARFEKKGLRALGTSIFSWTGKTIDIVLQDAAATLRDALRSKLDVSKTVNEVATKTRQSLQSMRQHMMSETGLNESQIVQLMVKGTNDSKDKLIRVTNKAGETAAYTVNQAVKLYMQFQDPSLRRGLKEGNQYTFENDGLKKGESTEEQLKAQLDAVDINYRKMGDGLVKFYRKEYAKLNAAFKDETGEDLDFNEFYSGYASRDFKDSDNVREDFQAHLDEMTQRFNRKGAYTPKTTIDRVNSDLALNPADAFMDAITHSAQQAHWDAWRKRKDLARLFSDPDVVRLITERFGSRVMASIAAHLTDMTQGQQVKNKSWLDFLHKLLRNSGTAFLGANIIRFPQQLSGVVNLALELPSEKLIGGMLDFWNAPKQNLNRIIQSDWFKNRYSNFDQTVMGALLEQDLNALRTGGLKNALLLPLKLGDMAVAILGGHALYKYHSETMSQQDAIHEAGNAINRTQSSGTVDQLSDLAREPHKKVLAIFMQQPMRMFEYQLTAMREYANDQSAANASKLARTVMATRLAQFAFSSVATAWVFATSDEDDDRQNALFNLIMQTVIGPSVPIIGDAVHAFATITRNVSQGDKWDRGFYGFNIVPFEAAARSFQLYGHALEAMEDGEVDSDEMFKLVIDYSRSINLFYGGLPIEAPTKLGKTYLKNDGDLFKGAPTAVEGLQRAVNGQ